MTAPRVDVLRARVAALQEDLRRILGEATPVAAPGDAGAVSSPDAEEVRVRADCDAQCRAREAEADARRVRVEEAYKRATARIDRAYTNARARADRRSGRELERIHAERLQAETRIRDELAAGRDRLLAPIAAALSEADALRGPARELRDRVALFASDLRAELGGEALPAASLDAVPPAQALETARACLDEVRRAIESRLRERGVRFARACPGGLTLSLLFVLAVGAVLAAVHQLAPGRLPDAGLTAAAALPAGWVAIALFRAGMGRWVRRAVGPLHDGVSRAESLLQRHAAACRVRERMIHASYQRELAARRADLDERTATLERQARRTAEIRLGILEDQRAHLMEWAGRRRAAQLAREEARREQERGALHAERDRLLDGLRLARESARQARAREDADRRDRAWARAVDAFDRAAEADRCLFRKRVPPWDDPQWPDLRLPADFPDAVGLGEIRFALDVLVPEAAGRDVPGSSGRAVSLPLALAFPSCGSLILSADVETRDRALQALSGAVLRVLCAFPPGKAKLTLFDPVGLGQNFSALMHLADYDESLVGGRIWTETAHFERKLAELTEHIEKVIQKYLRNRYGTIGEYNREVAQLAEAYRFLVIADFPTGFSDLAIERLASIVTSGARCGVYTMILRDRRQKPPAALNLAGLRTRGAALFLQAAEAGFVVEDETLGRGLATIAPPPSPNALTAILHAVGRQCRDAGRVELDFETVAPMPDRLWTERAENGLRIPLGRASADRLQCLELGRGTAQHALVAGKTGSGKSTLFHVLITSAALWYPPREVELYLIDFKKGVEFKTYATHALPHARVVAIESDREFGLSVLRRIDRELADRAERFRACGVQDFADCRRAQPDLPLPRTLLLIDEFQEFFVEEDAIAQEAALLLDRIVRQGRAFGVHAVLGSQTLGGSYTLARTTLGQMAVRIALQCNEADSYLILSDDNSAARLLSRPGEAIYNDMSGAVEGNNPFQVAWLPDEVRDRCLRAVGERAARERPAAPGSMMIFEGNVPAELRDCRPLRERLAAPFRVGTDDAVAWVGEANAIKGPTEVRFRRQTGGSLLVVGQHREAAGCVLVSSLLSLAVAHPPGAARFVLLDGCPPELPIGARFDALAETIPHGIERVDYSRVGEALAALEAEVRSRQERNRTSGARVFLAVFDLQRFRMLRQRSEFDLGGGEEEAFAPDRAFATILAEGPAQGVHTLLWSDSVNTLNRILGRKTLQAFQMRILFQMSGTDSSELIDAPLAAGLGLYRGLLYLDESGTAEKFRPYTFPDAALLAEVRSVLGGAAPPAGR